jgi:hypothetical protein
MATISFYADDLSINLNGSGLGFFGAGGFGQSVEVGAWQGTTFITNGNGTINGGGVENTKYPGHPDSGINSTLGTNPVVLRAIPNRLATLNIRFEHTSAVKLQNTKLRIFDRSNINNGASGVTTKVAQIIHPYDTGTNGSGDLQWATPVGSTVPLSLQGSPGSSGWKLTSAVWTDTRHDYFVVISASPNSIGAKTLYGLYVETEYL